MVSFLLCCIELIYDDVFSVWETIWAARHMTSSHFVLFIALALVQVYRDIILDNNMDFTDIIKFFNGKSYIVNDIHVLNGWLSCVWKLCGYHVCGNCVVIMCVEGVWLSYVCGRCVVIMSVCYA